MKSFYTLLLVALLGLPAGASARDRHLLWAVEGEHNTVWLLGSVHVLRAGEHDVDVGLHAHLDPGGGELAGD